MKGVWNRANIRCSASLDILRLYDLKESAAFKHATVPYLVVPGPPRPGVQAALHIDPTCKYMLSAAGNRGWEGSSTEVLIGYEIGVL
jgi:transcriptional activator SPT8